MVKSFKIQINFSILLFILLFSCSQQQSEEKYYSRKTSNTEVIMETSSGALRFILYEQTPAHKEHFINLIKKGLLKNSNLHLIIPDYTIQCGCVVDEKKKQANNDLKDIFNKKIKPEIHAEFIHKKGVLGASRLPNEINPEKYSDPFQFYIVLGSRQSDFELDLVEKKINQQIFYETFRRKNPYRVDTLTNLSEENQKKYKTEYEKKYQEELTKFKNVFHYSPEQRKSYKTLGGLPKLDQNYTIFGELIEGTDTLDSLCIIKKDEQHKPLEEVKVNWMVAE